MSSANFPSPASLRRAPRRIFLVGSLLAAVGTGAYLMFGASDQRRILSSLRELAAAASSLPGDTDRARAQRVRAVLGRSTLPNVVLSVPELGTFEGRDEIASAFELGDGLGLRLSIEQSDVRVKQSRAEATLLMSLVTKLPGEERRQVRTVSVELARRGDAFLISSLSVSTRSDEQHEARP